MKYFFVLGTNPALSLAELTAVLPLNKLLLIDKELLIAEVASDFSADALIRRLGGIIKIGVIHETLPIGNRPAFAEAAFKLAAKKQRAAGAGKFNFGFSDYGGGNFNKQDLGVRLKKNFQEQGISSRFVVSKEKNLSSVVIAQNKLLKRGIEIILAGAEGQLFLGETLAVQPFKDLSLRDYGRPARDDASGMLPPKLAQAMLNLAQIDSANGLLLDPFCGSGTILTEAMVLGHKNIFGTDVSAKAIMDTKKNISWVKELYRCEDVKMKFLVKNVLDLDKFIKQESVGAIVTEPYLGPQRGRLDFAQISRELSSLYSQALRQFWQVLSPGGRVVMVWPVFYGEHVINPDISAWKQPELLPAEISKQSALRQFLTTRGNLLYGRSGQKVFREIVVLERR